MKINKPIFPGLRQTMALLRKEFLQIIREPSSYLVALILPLLFLVCFGYAISLDATVIRLALLQEGAGPKAQGLQLAFTQSPHFKIFSASSRAEAGQMLSNSVVQGVFVIPEYFDTWLEGGRSAPTQLMVNGADPNTAKFVSSYAEGLVNAWQMQTMMPGVEPPISAEALIWYNPSAKSRWGTVPGSVTVIMTLIGTLLTSLVITREWERGTMEAMFASPVSRLQLFLGKLIPYYCLGMLSMVVCVLFSVWVFNVPFRGSVLALFLLSSSFLMPALGQGLLISSLFRNQFLSAMIGFLSGLLPALILSGLVYDINSMPWPLQLISMIIPARYLNVCLQTLFLAGDIYSVFLPRMAYMLGLGAVFFVLTYRNLKKEL